MNVLAFETCWAKNKTSDISWSIFIQLHNITLVNVYAPTEDIVDEIVYKFYKTMESVCDELPKHDAVITLGDFNAKLGKEQIYRDIIGRHSLHDTTSNNGFWLVQYATTNNFKVLSTWYPRKDIHKGNWKIPGTEDTNQIDHILVSKEMGDRYWKH